ncbi:MAG: undecaprenyldiphospho-muramoylpentapeptide beta-N-acetylglucosaminyltransferase [Gemmatimonadetes bacterium]|nr:undecaprenyldiphospho-muramoylpentapeptide beta-N-acetylglucosaminyltransferase [Gemmatimonadota bacterium]
MKVLIAGGGTGGHLMPGFALAAALKAARPDIEPVMVGARRGVDATLLPTRPWRHYLLSMEPVYRGAWWRNVRWPLIAWKLRRECRDVLDREQPALVVGTGGYVSGPILFAAHRSGIPVAIQEQNAYPGFATRLLARIAQQVHLGFPEAERHLKPARGAAVFALGNPIVPPPTDPGFRARARASLGIPADARVLLVTGGSQGARAINDAVAGAFAERLLEDVYLLWSTGAGTYDDFRRLDAPPRRQVRAFWDPIADAYALADIVVARAGAMTTAEICAYGLPSILVPLPTAAAGHQTQNAEALEKAGVAIHLPESALNPEALAREVRGMLDQPARRATMAEAAAGRGRPDAAQKIVEELLKLAK